MARRYFMIFTKIPKSTKVLVTKYLDQREPEKSVEPVEILLFFPLKDDPIKCIQIGSLLPKEKNQLLDFLHQNIDIFVWSALDMPKIPP